MTNAELIDALRNFDLGESCPCENQRMCEENDCIVDQAADALEAANERIVNLLTALHLANEKLAYVDCQPYTEIDGAEMIEDWVKTLVYEELHTQMDGERKDGERRTE